MARRPLRPVTLLVGVSLLVAVAVTSGAAAGAATQPTARQSVAVEVVDIDTGGLDRLIALAGAPHQVDVTVRVANAGPRVQRNVVVRLESATDATAAMPITLAPGDATTVQLSVQASALPGATHDLVVSAGDTSIGATHRQTPWLLVVAAILGVHLTMLSVRDRLRARVTAAQADAAARVQPSPSQTWARSSR